MTIMTATAAESTAEFTLHTVGDRPHHLYVYNDVGRFVGEIVRCEHPRDAPPWIAYDICGERLPGEFRDATDAARAVVRGTQVGERRSAVDDAVRLVVEDHMTYRAAAAKCGVSVGAITNRLARDRCACGRPMQAGAQWCAACRTVLRVVSDAELIERRSRGETIAVIAAEMGRTHSSVATRLTQLRNQGAGIPYKPGGAVMAEKGRAAVQRRWARTKDFTSSTKPESASGLPK